jgi:sugar phosphate isomerase/epimerase
MIRLCAFADESDSSLLGQIDALKRNGISLLEIRVVDGENIFNVSLEKAQEIYKTLTENNIKVWSIGSPVGKVFMEADFEEYLPKVERLFKIANILHTDKIRIFSFFNAYDKKEEVFNRLQRMVDLAKSYGVELYHENEKDIYGDSVERTVEILDNVKGIKCIYDPANFIQYGATADYSLSRLHHRADYFHIKDVVAETGELVPAGEGSGNIDKLVADITIDTVLTLEPHLAIFEGYKSIDNTEMKNKYVFNSNKEAFDCAVNSLKKVLLRNGYKEVDGGYSK